MKLEIISPETKIVHDNVTSVSLPGEMSAFTVLQNHAPIISSLVAGKISFSKNGQNFYFRVDGGFVEIRKNKISVCVERIIEE
ncbi:MAG: F0F1 ATP synthase subunit epsilon [Paludibacteraceae bacterium]|nr:F0F1 ATP synthase subunit epsilon [Paludibacteraceae bacterium]MBO7316608.1 F0F1 ATP synthase subunit epsilon [Paludibacteraceae bacterium]